MDSVEPVSAEVPPFEDHDDDLVVAPVWTRALALLLDLFIVGAVARLCGWGLGIDDRGLELISGLVMTLYAAVCFLSPLKATLAMALLRIRLAAPDASSDPSLRAVLIRVALVGILLTVAALWSWALLGYVLGGLFALLSRRKQTVWDLLGGTTVAGDWRTDHF